MAIKENIAKLRKEIPSSVTIVAATKKRSVLEIEQAIGAGISVIGENYVQEAEKKYAVLKDKAKFHLIGHLQMNKVKKAVKIFDMLQTVDSISLAEEINRHTPKKMAVLIEVNIADEPNKTGCSPDKVREIVSAVQKLKNLSIQGFMTMAPFFEDPEKARPFFRKMKQLTESYGLPVLSMGMSDSYNIAIEEGSTMIRLGTKLFGPRT